MRKFWWLFRWTSFCVAIVAFAYYAPRWVTAAAIILGILAYEVAKEEIKAEKAQAANHPNAMRED